MSNEIYSAENEVDGIVLISEDAQEYLNPRQEIAYREHCRDIAEWMLLRLHTVSIISNQPPPQLQLEPRSRSRLAYQPIEFRSYTEQKLAAILEQRVEDAFRNGTAPENVIKKIASTVAEQNGDCRGALTLLLRTGRQAEQENVDVVTVHHVEQALSSGENLREATNRFRMIGQRRRQREFNCAETEQEVLLPAHEGISRPHFREWTNSDEGTGWTGVFRHITKRRLYPPITLELPD